MERIMPRFVTMHAVLCYNAFRAQESLILSSRVLKGSFLVCTLVCWYSQCRI